MIASTAIVSINYFINPSFLVIIFSISNHLFAVCIILTNLHTHSHSPNRSPYHYFVTFQLIKLLFILIINSNLLFSLYDVEVAPSPLSYSLITAKLLLTAHFIKRHLIF